MKKKLEELWAKLNGLKSAIEQGDEVAIKEGMELKAEIEKTEKAIQKDADKEALLNVIGPKSADVGGGEAPARNLGDHVVRNVKTAELGKKFSLAIPEFKAATDTQVTPAAEGASVFATHLDRNVVTAPRTALTVRDLFGAETISGSTLIYLVEGAAEGAPAVTAEGALKPQMHFADPTPVTVSLDKVAAFIKESDEYVKDYPFLASAINGRLLYHLGLAEQNKLVADLLGTSGIQTDTTGWGGSTKDVELADLILKAAMDVQETSGFAADAILLNPSVWYQLRVARNESGNYYGGGFFGAQNIPNLWGINVCVSPAVAADKIVVGAFKSCGSVVNNGGVSVDMTNTDQDDFVKNLMTIRAEERLALAIRRPAGFKLITKQ